MDGARKFPLAGTVIAVAGATAMLVAGADVWLTAAISALWLGSLWLGRIGGERPETVVRSSGRAQIPFGRMDAMIEPLGIPLMLLDRGRIALANAAAREALGGHILGQDARIALRHPEAVRLLESPGGGAAVIRGLTSARSIWHLASRPIDARYTVIELADRTAEADISRAHTDFVANASHELRTPLASIIGYVETLTDPEHPVAPADAERFYATVLHESRRMESLVEDLMSLSRIEAEKHEMPAAAIDLGALAHGVVEEMAAFGSGLQLKLVADASGTMIRGDRRQLEQLIRNLADNALKYGNPHQPVGITVAARSGGFVELTVRDSGPGIDAEHLPHLTRRFYRTDPGRSRAAGGTGLGLAIVKHIVERHRGRLDIASANREGTTVTVRFPGLAPVPGNDSQQSQ